LTRPQVSVTPKTPYVRYSVARGNMAALLAISVLRVSIAAVWVLTPVILIGFAIREWYVAGRAEPRRRLMPIAVALAVLADWASFLVLVALGFIGGFGSHYATTRMANWFIVGSLALLVLAIATRVARGKLALASLLVLALWVGSEVVA
jgi:hypothetical protein